MNGEECDEPIRVDPQETFDRVVAHLRQQGQQATDRSGVCMLRAANGMKCAIGCLIPDEVYEPAFEATLIHEGCESLRMVLAGHYLPLLGDLQIIHDASSNWGGSGLNEKGERRLRRVAAKHKLIYTLGQSGVTRG